MVKNTPTNAGDVRRLIRSLGREDPPDVGMGNPLQYSCLENPLDRGAWRATAHSLQRVGHN